MESRNGQSIVVLSASPRNPMSELMAIIKREVPAAVLNGKPVKKINAGIIRNPPPAPTNPVRKPMIRPSAMTKKNRTPCVSETFSCFPRIIEKDARIISNAKVPRMSTRFESVNESLWKITSGIAGIIHFRVKKMLMTEGIPKRNPVLILTVLSLYLGIAPTKLVTPTMNNEYADANTASTLKR